MHPVLIIGLIFVAIILLGIVAGKRLQRIHKHYPAVTKKAVL